MKEILRRFFDNLGDIAHVDCFSCLFAPKAALSVTLRYSGGDYTICMGKPTRPFRSCQQADHGFSAKA
jgi:hypothetical protein